LTNYPTVYNPKGQSQSEFTNARSGLMEIPPKVLVVDDEPFVVEVFKGFLTRAGYNVITASDGIEAIHKATTEHPDVITLDVIMPEMNGFEVCRKLKSDEKTFVIPIIMVTALGAREDRIKSIDAGAEDFLTKPMPDSSELLARVKSSLKIKKYADELKILNERLEKTQKLLAESLQRYVNQQITEEILQNPQAIKLSGEKKEITILISDIRNFTQFAEVVKVEELINQLNEYFSAMTDIVFEYGGTLDKFMGDAIMAIFGAFVSHDDDALMAIQCAIDMQRQLEVLNENWATCGRSKIKIGIGITTGEAIVGNIGSDKKMEYTAIGQNAILAQRIEKLTKQFPPYDILIDESTFAKVQEKVEMGLCPPYPKIFVEKFAPISIEGKQSPIAVYGVKVP